MHFSSSCTNILFFSDIERIRLGLLLASGFTDTGQFCASFIFICQSVETAFCKSKLGWPTLTHGVERFTIRWKT